MGALGVLCGSMFFCFFRFFVFDIFLIFFLTEICLSFEVGTWLDFFLLFQVPAESGCAVSLKTVVQASPEKKLEYDRNEMLSLRHKIRMEIAKVV